HVHVDGLVGTAVGQPPDVGEQVPAGHYLAGPQRQVMQQVEFAAAQVKRCVVQRSLVPVRIQAQAADGEQAGGGGVARGRTAEYRADPGFDLAWAERLDDVVIRAGVEHPDDVSLVIAGGDDHDGNGTDGSHHPQRLEPADVRQPEVEQDQV